MYGWKLLFVSHQSNSSLLDMEKKISITFSNKLWKVIPTSPSSKNTNSCPQPWSCFTISLFPSASSRMQRTWSLNDFFPFNFVGLLFILFISPLNLLEILLDFPWLGVLTGQLEVLGRSTCLMHTTLIWHCYCICNFLLYWFSYWWLHNTVEK